MTAIAALLLLVSTHPLAAQAGTPAASRALLVPQFGVPVGASDDGDFVARAGITAEFPVRRGWSLSAEGMAALGNEQWACPADVAGGCNGPTSLRFGLSAGVVAQPGRVGPLAPFAGVSAGGARWTRAQDSGFAPMATLRGGVDVQIAGPVGARVELIRRIAWTGTEHGSPLYADALSLGARIALRR